MPENATISIKELSDKLGTKTKLVRKFLRRKVLKGVVRSSDGWVILKNALAEIEAAWKDRSIRAPADPNRKRRVKDDEQQKPPKEFEDGASHWWGLRTQGNTELRIARLINDFRTKQVYKMELVEEVYAPTYKVKSEKGVREIVLFSKILFIKTSHIKDLFWKVKEVSEAVKGWWGKRTADGRWPYPIEAEYISALRKEYEGKICEEHEEQMKKWEVDDHAEILSGPFRGFIGKVVNVDRVLTLEVAIFGRLTPVNIDYNSVKHYEEAHRKDTSYEKKERRLKHAK